MDQVATDVEDRLAQVGAFLEFVQHLENPRKRKAFESVNGGALPTQTLKACAFLLLYNVVESCVRASFGDAYSELQTQGGTYGTASERFRGLWIKQQLDVPTDSANHQTYLDATTAVAISISTAEVLSLDSRKLPISGNLDADAIRLLCARHGVQLKVPKWAKGGVELSTVKDQRNALAHGNKSFLECGRDYTIKDLTRISKQTSHFLRGFIRSMRKFISKKGFMA